MMLFSTGEIYAHTKYDDMDVIFDMIRKYAEESDFCQSYSIFVDSNSAYGGLLVDILNQIHDDYGNRKSITFAINDGIGVC